MKTFHSYAELRDCAGQEVAVTDWVTVTQAQINLFAEATGDHQWIHVDPEKAAHGPFGTRFFVTVAAAAVFSASGAH